MLGLLAIMAIPVSWALAYMVMFVALLLDARPSGEFVVIVADLGALIAVFAAMHRVIWRWERMDRAGDSL